MRRALLFILASVFRESAMGIPGDLQGTAVNTPWSPELPEVLQRGNLGALRGAMEVQALRTRDHADLFQEGHEFSTVLSTMQVQAPSSCIAVSDRRHWWRLFSRGLALGLAHAEGRAAESCHFLGKRT